MGFPGVSAGIKSACSAGDLGSIPGLGRSPGGGHGKPLQCSCLEDPYGQRSLAGYSPRGHKELDTTEWLSTAPGWWGLSGWGYLPTRANFYWKHGNFSPTLLQPLGRPEGRGDHSGQQGSCPYNGASVKTLKWRITGASRWADTPVGQRGAHPQGPESSRPVLWTLPGSAMRASPSGCSFVLFIITYKNKGSIFLSYVEFVLANYQTWRGRAYRNPQLHSPVRQKCG